MSNAATIEQPRNLHLRRIFAVGQVWTTRKPEEILSPDHWRIEAITDHPESPVIARHSCGAVRCFGFDGHHEGDPDESALDLVRLIRDEKAEVV